MFRRAYGAFVAGSVGVGAFDGSCIRKSSRRQGWDGLSCQRERCMNHYTYKVLSQDCHYCGVGGATGQDDSNCVYWAAFEFFVVVRAEARALQFEYWW